MTNPLPLLTLIGDDILEGHKPFKTITIRWPRDSKIPTIRGKWYRLEDGRLEARYTRDELARCMEVFEMLNESK